MWSRGLLRQSTRLCRRQTTHRSRSIASIQPLFNQHVPVRKTEIDLPPEQILPVTGSSGTGSSGNSQSELRIDIPDAIPPDNDQGFTVEGGKPVAFTQFTFSEESQAKVGLVHARLVEPIPGRTLQGVGTHEHQISLLRRLDEACQKSTLRGLGCLAQALRTIDTVLLRTVDTAIEVFARTADSPIASSIVAHINASHQSDIEVGRWTIKATNGERLFQDLQISVHLHDNTNDEPNQLSTKPYKVGEDLWYLRETATMVVNRVTSAIQFESIEGMLESVAQSLLRILQPRTSSLAISMVKVKHIESGTRGYASWATTGEGSERDDDDRLTRKSNFTLTKDDLHGDHTRRKAEDQGDIDIHRPNVKQDFQHMSESVGSRSDQVYPNYRDKAGKWSLTIFPRRSEALQSRFGAMRYRMHAIWPADCGVAIQHLTRAEMISRVENALKRTPTGDLSGLRHAVDMLQTHLPAPAQIYLSLEQIFDHKTLGDASPLSGSSGALLRVSCNTHRLLSRCEALKFGTPALQQSAKRLQNTFNNKPQYLCVSVSLQADLAPTPSHDVVCSWQCSQILRAVKDVISLTLDTGDLRSMQELANECAQAILHAPMPFLGMLHIHAVTTIVKPWRAHDQPIDTTGMVMAQRCRASRLIVALGSNVGNRVENIEAACRAIDADPDMAVCATSALYETRPMYVEDQGAFVNGVAEISTTLSPTQLLNRLQGIENDLGRVKLIDKGPRTIDLDIVTSGQLVLTTERLTVPHKLMLEREFVLRPVCDIQPTLQHPVTQETMEAHLKQLGTGELSMFPRTPLAPGFEALRSLDPVRRTHLMSILNVTPDSFSDAGDNQPNDMDALRETIAAHIAGGATIIDIGGQSSRPNAPDITAEEEIARILPAIEILKSMPEGKHITISVDTYRAVVAEAAIAAGAHIINDISAGLMDPHMLPTVARLGCTYVMMHMRGTPATMQQPEHTAYKDGLVETIASELQDRLRAAQRAGIRRWRIILDPGVGFAKTAEQNAELLGRFGELRNHAGLKTYPWLIGSSRKGFIGKITGAEDPKDRLEGTAATVTAAIAGGAEIVRVHDVKEMARVVKVADAMYRRPRSITAGKGRGGNGRGGEEQDEDLDLETDDQESGETEEGESRTERA